MNNRICFSLMQLDFEKAKDSEIKPGKTEMRESSCYDDFDYAVMYISCRQ